MFAEMRSAHGDNLLSSMTELFASGVNFAPGFGLYVMAACLGVAAILVNSGLLRRVRLVGVASDE
jgi:hypothetical protein